MKKRSSALLLSLVLIVGLVFTGCSVKDSSDESMEFNEFANAVDSEFSKEVILKLSSFIDDPKTGNRSAGSPAEKEAADYLASKMEEIGLKNVTKDETTVDGWTYKGANIAYKNANGEEILIDLGGYATTLVTKDEKISLVYANEGTMDDYENLDVDGKLVLIDINQDENWWINWPAYQAKLKGARAVIAMTEMGIEAEDRLTSQDICGPDDAPAFAISKKDSDALKSALEVEGGEIEVVFNADSTVTKDTNSYNVWGEIPGKSDQVIYLIAHYDAYYRAVYDDAHGVGMIMGIMKALIDSNYVPEKTIRVIYHGAEEFGKTDSQYDWAAGDYVEEAGYEFAVKSPTGSSTEDLIWAKQGVPLIAANRRGDNPYGAQAYHSSYDSFEKNPMDENIFELTHKVMGKIILDLDKTAIRPINIESRMKALEESITSQGNEAKELLSKIESMKSVSEVLNSKIEEVEASKDAKAIQNMNDNLYKIYKRMQDDLLKMDYNLGVGFYHEMYQNNLEGLDLIIESLENKDVKSVIDEYVWMVDWAGYSMYFDSETVKYFLEQNERGKEGTWAENMMYTEITDMDSIVKSLLSKYDTVDVDVSSEIEELKKIKEQQENALKDVLNIQIKCLEDVTKMIDEL